MLSPYRRVLSRPGALPFAAAAFLGRMHLSMAALGTVLLVSAVTHSYGLAGAVSATLSVSAAVASPWLGRRFDRYGQRRVLLPVLLVFVAGIVALSLLAAGHAPHWTLFAAAAPAGATAPPLSSLVRTRWAALLGASRELETAYALESVLDEVIFVSGPVLVTVLSTTVAPAAGLLATVGFVTVGTLWFVTQRGTEPPRRAAGARPAARAMSVPGMRVLAMTYLLTGGLFGTYDVTMVAFAARHGSRGSAGWLLALIAGGSLTAGLAYGVRHWRLPLSRRFVLASAALPFGSLALVAAPNLTAMAPAAFVAGLAIAPSLIAGYGLVERLVPAASLTEGLTRVGSSIGIGFAAAASLSGYLVDVSGPRAAFLVGVGAATAAALVALAGQGLLSGRRRGVATAPTAEPSGL